MPWQYPENVPDSMKYFKPSIQRKGIKIANAVLRNGGDEGLAISVGIKNAKKSYSNSLIKLAYSYGDAFKQNKVKFGYIIGMGALTGAAKGYNSAFKKDKFRQILADKNGRPIKKENARPGRRALIGASIGAAAGLGLTGAAYKIAVNNAKKFSKHKQQYYDEQYSKYKGQSQGYTPPAPSRNKTNIESFFKEHGHDHTTIKTKAEAKRMHRETVKKIHPDFNPGIDPEISKKFNSDWDSVKNSSWFEKLAFILRKR